MYSKYQRNKAPQLYEQCSSVSMVIQKLGYLSRMQLYKWIKNKDDPPRKKRSRKRFNNTLEHPLHPPIELKLDVLHRCFERGESVELVSEEIGYSRTSIYMWRKKYIHKGATALMNTKDNPRGKLPQGEPVSSESVEQLKAQMKDMQLELDILKETLNVLKKDPGADMTVLTNLEKAVIVDAMKAKYSLSLLLNKLRISRSSYYYQQHRLSFSDKYAELSNKIVILFNQNKSRYGYRRIHGLLSNEGVRVSEKIVRKIMSAQNLIVKIKKKGKYNSYQGEITPAVPNVINRNFKAPAPNVKWLTDITEFTIPSGKVYLSSIVDCFDGMITAWNISTKPDAELVNNMLENAICRLSHTEHPLIHTDRGCHYRWPGWISRMKKAGLQRSMSKKGCSPDNSACEGFFGRLKNVSRPTTP